MGMAVGGGLQYLVSEFLDCVSREWSSNTAHVLFKVKLAEFEYEIEIVLLVNHLFQTIEPVGQKFKSYLLYHIGVLDTLQERNFSDRCARHSVIFFFQLDLFDGHDLY